MIWIFGLKNFNQFAATLHVNTGVLWTSTGILLDRSKETIYKKTNPKVPKY